MAKKCFVKAKVDGTQKKNVNYGASSSWIPKTYIHNFEKYVRKIMPKVQSLEMHLKDEKLNKDHLDVIMQ